MRRPLRLNVSCKMTRSNFLFVFISRFPTVFSPTVIFFPQTVSSG